MKKDSDKEPASENAFRELPLAGGEDFATERTVLFDETSVPERLNQPPEADRHEAALEEIDRQLREIIMRLEVLRLELTETADRLGKLVERQDRIEGLLLGQKK